MASKTFRITPGELYIAFTPKLIEVRRHVHHACESFNTAPASSSRRHLVSLWRQIIQDLAPLPPEIPDDPAADEAQFTADPWIAPPIRMDYGNVYIGAGSFLNFNSVFVDTCNVKIGANVLVGPNVSFFSGTHPIDPAIRRGLEGPELGWEIHVEDDCWIGGNAVICPGVRIGRGSTVGAGSVVTKASCRNSR